MSKRKKHKKFFKRNRIAIIISLLLVSYLSVVFANQQIKLHELKEEENMTLLRIQELQEQKEELDKRLGQSDDLDFVEKVAREKLKMVKPNEIIYIIQNKDEEKEE